MEMPCSEGEQGPEVGRQAQLTEVGSGLPRGWHGAGRGGAEGEGAGAVGSTWHPHPSPGTCLPQASEIPVL